jgi:hypothetical protein
MASVLKWLDDNPLGIALGALCGLLLLVLLVLTLLAALPPSTATVPPEGSGGEGLQLPVLAEKLPLASYAAITERPLFSENRQPASADGASAGESLPLDEPSGAPEVELSGVIITPTLRMVTLQRTDDAKSLVAFEGKPIEAEFGSWQVSSIQARSVTLTSGGGEELQLELKVHDAMIEQPVQPVKPAKREEAPGEQAPEDAETPPAESLSRAEEIRQRIAERREELRRESELNGAPGGQSDAAVDQSAEQGADRADGQNYQQAIQALMGRGKKTKNDDEQ